MKMIIYFEQLSFRPFTMRVAVLLMSVLLPIIVFAHHTGEKPTVKVMLQSAGELEFGPSGVLFVGDSYGAQVVAIETDDQQAPQNAVSGLYVKSAYAAIADLLGADAHRVVINDMAVNPASQNIYFSVHVGRSINPEVAIVRYTHQGQTFEKLDLSKLTMTQVAIPNAPTFQDGLQYGQSQRVLSITDLTYYNGELLVAGVSNQEFASTLRRVAYPFSDKVQVASIEIYHAAHGQRETRAPIVTQLVYEIAGEPYLVAAYTCTPLVKIPLRELRDGAHVVGTTVAELGFGNTPVDMFLYTNPEMLGGGERLLVTNDSRSAISISPSLLAEAEPLTERVPGPTGLDQFALPLTGSLHTAPLNEAMTLILRPGVENPEDLSLMTVLTGAFFEVSSHIVEYNWPEVPNSNFPSTNPVEYGFEQK